MRFKFVYGIRCVFDISFVDEVVCKSDTSVLGSSMNESKIQLGTINDPLSVVVLLLKDMQMTHYVETFDPINA